MRITEVKKTTPERLRDLADFLDDHGIGMGDHSDRPLIEAAANELERLRAALEMLAQIRHVGGSAQGVFRSNLRLVDAVLAGADVRDLATVEAIAEGAWKP